MRWMSLALILAATGCGVPEDALLSELDDGDWEKVCDELEPAVSEQCFDGDSGATVSVNGPDECLAAALAGQIASGCTATAGHYWTCMEQLHEDPCVIRAEDPPQACVEVFACLAL